MRHHAYFFEGPTSLLSALAEDARAQFGLVLGSPDMHVEMFERFGIDESRSMIASAALKTTAGQALYILGIASITTQAQQALLKLLEEPQQGVAFVLLVPHGILLPTVRSRMLRYEFAGTQLEKSPQKLLAGKFLHSTGKARSDEIALLLKDEENTKERVREFLQALEGELFAALSKAKEKKPILTALEDVGNVRGYLADTAPALKMLLEHLAVAVPQL